MMKKYLAVNVVVVMAMLHVACTGVKKSALDAEKIAISRNEAGKSYDVRIGGKLFTSYRWPDSVFKPVLYPIINASGTEVTRGYPVQPRPGERTDHPHHVGMWFNYGNVNGIDFWGNSMDIPEETRKKTGGTIKFLRAENIKEGKGKSGFTVFNSWQDPAGNELLYEKTEFEFLIKDSLRIIDRKTTLTATTGNVSFPDTKEGMFAIRVARQLELPSQESVTLTDASGNATTVSPMSNEGVSGNYRSSEGITGEEVWGTRARWMKLSGIIAQDSVTIAICDHPSNPGYPTHWHARGYGLFAVNPFGVKDFSGGKEEKNFSIPANQSATFRYRVIISAGKQLSDAEVNNLSDEFSKNSR